MNNATLLYQLITVIGLLIPIGTLIWKAAKQSGKIEELEKRVSHLEKDYKADIDEIKESINKLENSLIKIETSIAYIEKSITTKRGKNE